MGQSDQTVLVCHVSAPVAGMVAALAAALLALAALLARVGALPLGPSSRDLLGGGSWRWSTVCCWVGLGGTWRTLAMA